MSIVSQPTQVTITTERRSWEIIFSLKKGAQPEMFIRREELVLNNGTVFSRRELPGLVVDRTMLTPSQISTLSSLVQAIDGYADTVEQVNNVQ